MSTSKFQGKCSFLIFSVCTCISHQTASCFLYKMFSLLVLCVSTLKIRSHFVISSAEYHYYDESLVMYFIIAR